MPRYEYKVVPAPRKGEKAKGAKTTPDRFAVALTHLMNTMGAEGWDYVRADTLPCDERVGFTGSKTTFQNMLVFRRVLAEGAEAAPVMDEVPAAAPRLMAVPESGIVPLAPSVQWPASSTAPSVGPARLAAE